MQKTLKIAKMMLAALAMSFLVIGCAISDYDGIPGHKTTGEAKVLTTEVSFSGFGADLDGTYAHTVKYGTGSGVSIFTYRNATPSSFTREGLINVDGDDVQGMSGIAGGQFNNQWLYIDSNPGVCDFDLNRRPNFANGIPGVELCVTGNLEEIDKDHELNASFTSFGALISDIWSGAVTGSFSVEITGITLDGTSHAVPAVALNAVSNGLRPTNIALINQPTVPGLIQTILDNTNHLEPVTLGFTFDGGMTLDLPSQITVAFNHDVLTGLL